MKIIKDGSASGSVCTEQELQAINAFAKAQLTADEVYAFQVLLCDNEVDRDFERFSVSTLRELSELFVGATGICDHDWRSENQVARIYRTELVTEKGKTTSCGEAYVYLKGFAYMLRTEANAELIAQIEGGIKRETSVRRSVAQSICSICGAEIGTCSHEKGKVYGEDGVVDVMNMAWGGICAENMVSLNISEGHKTSENIKKRGAFTLSIADIPHIKEADFLGTASGNTMPDKFARSGLTAVKSEKVDAPVIQEFP